MAAQLVTRRVYNAKNELIREGLVPKDIANTREALMAYWAEQDRQDAEAEAAAAQAAVEELQAPVVPDAAELVAPLVDRLAAVEGRLDVVNQLAVATPEQVLAGTMAISRAAGAAALVEAATATTLVQLDGAVKAADERLAGIEGTVGQTAAAVGELLADVRASAETAEAQRDAKLATAISKRITQLEVQAAQLRGPKGERGRIGQGLIAGAGKRPEKRPDGSDWAPGDSWMNTKAEGFTLEYLAADGSWSQPARLVPAPKLINATQNVLDMAPRQATTIVQSGSASSGGGGQERLMTSRQGGNLDFVLADSSNYGAAGQLISGGEITIRLVSETTGLSGLLVATFTLENTNHFSYTSFSELGDLYLPPSTFSVDLSGSHQPPTIPAGITAGGSTQQALIIKARINGPGTYQITGGVSWTLKGDGIVVPKGGAGPQPAWTWA